MKDHKIIIEELRIENERLRKEISLLKTNFPEHYCLKINERLEAINEIIHFAVSEMADIDFILEIICRGIRQIFGFHRVGIMLINEEDKTLEGRVSFGLPKEYIKKLKLPLKLKDGLGMRESVVRAAILGEPILVLDRTKDPQYINRKKYPEKSFSRQFIVIPIKTRKKTYGILTVATSEESSLLFNDQIIEEIKFFTEQVSILVENLMLVENNEKLHFQILGSLAETIEAKDSSTGGHSNRVVKYSMFIANRINLSFEQKKDLHFASVLHDIGKIGIPDQILLKPGKLTKKEREVIKTHSNIGKKIISGIEGLENVGNVILHHHERWDGGGYPMNLQGKNIPILARIVSISDSFDAMISKRPYKEPFTIEYAITELINNRGTQFDPELVDVFVDYFKD
ncbi:HD domain-containing protein [bacterium]|nr:HD domain-containing protein [bacterium]